MSKPISVVIGHRAGASPNRSDRRLIVIMLALFAASVLWAVDMHRASADGPQRLGASGVVRVDAAGALAWGVSPGVLDAWGVPVELVDRDADVTVRVGPTPCREVEGFGTACVAGEARSVVADGRVQCMVTLSDRGGFVGDAAAAVVLHEVGHCLGLRHDDTRPSVMGTAMHSETVPNPLWRDVPTVEDRAAAAARMAAVAS